MGSCRWTLLDPIADKPGEGEGEGAEKRSRGSPADDSDEEGPVDVDA